MHRRNTGFTLIELTAVIVIVGVLASVALPPIANLRTEARIAAVRAFAGALYGAAAMLHAKWLVAGGSGRRSVTIEGSTVAVDPLSGYPEMSAAGIGVAMQCESASLCQGMKIDYASFLTLFTPAGVNNGRCTVFYNKASGTALVDVSRCEA
jgi:prepilin-type N-terminal cleavage/methylation domain-containing protein